MDRKVCRLRDRRPDVCLCDLFAHGDGPVWDRPDVSGSLCAGYLSGEALQDAYWSPDWKISVQVYHYRCICYGSLGAVGFVLSEKEEYSLKDRFYHVYGVPFRALYCACV